MRRNQAEIDRLAIGNRFVVGFADANVVEVHAGDHAQAHVALGRRTVVVDVDEKCDVFARGGDAAVGFDEVTRAVEARRGARGKAARKIALSALPAQGRFDRQCVVGTRRRERRR